jgi:hypothetical protein
MNVIDVRRWTLVSDADSVRGSLAFQPTYDDVVAWNDETGLRLQRNRKKGEFYLALRDGTGSQSWRVAPYPMARDIAAFLDQRRNGDIRLWHYASANASIEILILDCGNSVWAVLNVPPSPTVLMGLFLRFPAPIRFTWPGKLLED